MPTTREIYDALDLPTLERWVAEQQQEDLHLDFKLLAGKGELLRDDRKNLREAVSGFANGDGGLIVWGVNCRKNEEGIDAALNLQPIPNAAAVLSQLRDNPSQVTTPVVDGVEHRLIPASEPGFGFLVTYVPASDRGPHMANDRHYYKRNGTSFLTMEHFDVADMFGRRQRSDVRLRLQCLPKALEPRFYKYFLHARIKNHGRARASAFKVQVELPREVVDWVSIEHYDGQVHTLEHSQYLYPLFPGEEIVASFDATKYHMDADLFMRFRSEWPEVRVVIYQDDLPPLLQKISLESLVKRGSD